MVDVTDIDVETEPDTDVGCKIFSATEDTKVETDDVVVIGVTMDGFTNVDADCDVDIDVDILTEFGLAPLSDIAELFTNIQGDDLFENAFSRDEGTLSYAVAFTCPGCEIMLSRDTGLLLWNVRSLLLSFTWVATCSVL